jgi:hypothetical protein
MPFSMDWHNPEKTALRIAYSGTLDANDVFAAHHAAYQLLETVNYPVIIVSDYRAATSTVLGALGRTRPIMEMRYHPNTSKLIIYVGVNRLIATLGRIALRLYPARFAGRELHIVQTIEQVDLIIQKHTANSSFS